MTRKLIFIWCCCNLLAISALADDHTAANWQKGNDCYARKAYDSAAYFFEQIAALKPINAEVYYNLGNTYYRLNKIGPAVVNYERALKISPSMQNAAENLALTENRITNHIQVVNEIFFVKWWNNMTHPTHASAWSVAALIIFLLMLLTIGLRRLKPGMANQFPIQIVFVLGFFWLCTITMALIVSARAAHHDAAVVMQNDSPLMPPDLHSKPITQLPEGTTIEVLDEKDSWVEVRIPDGRVGWMQLSLIEKI